jgi:hypothetical protein
MKSKIPEADAFQAPTSFMKIWKKSYACQDDATSSSKEKLTPSNLEPRDQNRDLGQAEAQKSQLHDLRD